MIESQSKAAGENKREPARKYTDVLVWQKAKEAVKTVYRVTAPFPKSEMFGLTLQMRRAAVSIPSNIAEGFGRRSTRHYAQFLLVARGSLFELETQMILANEIGFLGEEDFRRAADQIDEVERMLDSLIRSVQASH